MLTIPAVVLHALGGSALAATIKGTVGLPSTSLGSRALGYTKTRVTGPSKISEEKRASLALFLAAKDSLPLPKPEQPPEIRIYGLGLEPQVAACPIDARVVFTNMDSAPVTVRVGGDVVGKLDAGASKTYECTAGTPGKEFRGIKIDEWPHMRGWVYVGEVGVGAVVDAAGQFRLLAPEGTYVLRFIREGTIVAERSLTVGKTDVDLGKTELSVDAREPEGSALPSGSARPAEAAVESTGKEARGR